MKPKDIIAGVAAFLGVAAFAGLLIAWSDGRLEGTVVEAVLAVVVPAAAAGWVLVVCVHFWIRFFFGKRRLPVWTMWLVFFLAISLFLLLGLPDKVYMIAMLVEAAILAVSLLALIFTK